MDVAATVRSRSARAATAALVAVLTVVALVGGSLQPAAAAPPSAGMATWTTATIDLPNGAVAYDAWGDKLLVAVSPSVPTLGNHLVEINPHNGIIVRSVAVGADPRSIAVSDDGTRAYVGGLGSSYVTEIDMESFTVTRQMFLGNDTSSGGYYTDDIEVQPGDASVIAVVRRNQGLSPRHEGVAIFDDGEMRETVTPGHGGPDRLTWDADRPNTIYGYDDTSSPNTVYVLTVDEAGVTAVGHRSLITGSNQDIEYAEGKIVGTRGQVVDASTLTLDGSYTAKGPFAIDIGIDTAYFIDDATLTSHSTDTLLPTGSRTVPNISPSALIETESTLVASSATKIMMIGPEVSVSGFALPAAPVSRLRTWGALAVPLTVEQLAGAPDGEHVYGVVRQDAATRPGQLVEISTATGQITRSLLVGADPHRVAVSADGSTVMVGHDDASTLTEVATEDLAVRRTITLTAGEHAADIDARPETATTFAVVLAAKGQSPALEGQILVQDGVIAANRGPDHTGITSGAFTADPDRFYGINSGTSDFGFYTLQADTTGLTPLSDVRRLSRLFSAEVVGGEQLVYSTKGPIFDPAIPSVVGWLPAGHVVPVEAEGRVLVVAGSTVQEIDTETLSAVRSAAFTGGAVQDAVAAGSNLAVATAGGTIHIIPVGDPDPTVTELSPATGEPTGGNTVTITGTALRGATAVAFGTTAATSFTVVSDTEITAVAPARPEGAVNVTVTTPGGTSDASSANVYTYDWPGRAPNESWVLAAYEDFLGREPTVEELEDTVDRLDGGETRGTIARELATSQEWISQLVIGFYTDTLDREPTSDELAYWAEELATGRRTVAQVAASFYASAEYFGGVGGGTDATWIEDLYTKLLGRSATAGDVEFWSGRVAARGRGWVALQLFQSLESRRARVTALYEALLGRAPDAAGRDYWAGRLTAEGDIALARNLAASAEYLALARTRFP